MPNALIFLIAVAGTGGLQIAASAIAAEFDLHHVWEDRCGECHGHAGAFARTLNVVDGQLVGRHHGRDLRAFMTKHYLGNLHVDAVYAMLLAQASTASLFKNKCSGCHADAASFARKSLQFRDDVLYGRASNRAVVEFLKTHQGLDANDADAFVATLERVAREVGLR